MNKFNDDIDQKKYFGYAHTLDKDDRRLKELRRQRDEQGFDDSEIWSLDCTVMSYMLPRLKRVIELRNERFVVSEEDKAEAVELISLVEFFTDVEHDKQKRERFLELFNKHFFSLWW